MILQIYVMPGCEMREQKGKAAPLRSGRVTEALKSKLLRNKKLVFFFQFAVFIQFEAEPAGM
jgi:hypothetical protein